MSRLDARTDGALTALTRDVQTALGDDLLCLALYGSAAGDDWVEGQSDLNVALVVPRVTFAVLEALERIVARWRRKGLAPPAVMDLEYLARARDIFPMEIDDIRRQHRVLAGRDVFADVTLDPAAIRRECEGEARGKLLRLRALFLESAGRPEALESLMRESVKSFLIVLRHWLALLGEDGAHDYRAVLRTAEGTVGPLPTMSALLDHREGQVPLDPARMRDVFADYLGEVERIVAAVDRLNA
jgi:hypothetical protein